MLVRARKGHYRELFEQILVDQPADVFSMGKLASIAFLENDDPKAQTYIDMMAENKQEYDYGYTSYFMGQAYAVGQNYPKAMKLLKEAVTEGDRFRFIDYENDPLLIEMHAMPEWQELMEYWK